MDKIILVYIQMEEETVEPVSLELLSKAKELARDTNIRIYAVSVGSVPKKMVQKLRGLPAERLYYFRMADKCYDVNLVATLITKLCRKMQPDIFLIGATKEGRNLAPSIAARLKTGLTADCTELRIEETGHLIQIRPAFGEKILATIRTKTRPQMATVRPGIMPSPEVIGCHEPILHVFEAYEEERLTLYDVTAIKPVEKTREVDITKEKVLVILGGGVSDIENVSLFREWACALGGTIACSRKLVEKGWFTASRQVGLSGNCVEAQLIITVGVSGSVQFKAGIQRVKHIIAINQDRKAPIMEVADTGIIMDLNVLVNELKRRKEEHYE